MAIKTDSITDQAGTGAPDFPNGLSSGSNAVPVAPYYYVAADINTYTPTLNTWVDESISTEITIPRTGIYKIVYQFTGYAGPANGNRAFFQHRLQLDTGGGYVTIGSEVIGVAETQSSNRGYVTVPNARLQSFNAGDTVKVQVNRDTISGSESVITRRVYIVQELPGAILIP